MCSINNAQFPPFKDTAPCKMCCVKDDIYLIGGEGSGVKERRVTRFNLSTNTWSNMPCLQLGRNGKDGLCTLDSKIFVVGADNTCELLDLNDDEDPEWKFFANMRNQHHDAGIVMLDRKIYVLSGCGTEVEVYDVDEGMFVEVLLTKYLIYFTFKIIGLVFQT